MVSMLHVLLCDMWPTFTFLFCGLPQHSPGIIATLEAVHVGFKFEVLGFNFEVLGFNFEVLNSNFEVLGFHIAVSGFNLEVPGFNVEVPGFNVAGSVSMLQSCSDKSDLTDLI